jgi:PIN domain nuclease of toxin-antitoxin system
LAACEEPTNELYLSVVSAWEIPHSIALRGRGCHR